MRGVYDPSSFFDFLQRHRYNIRANTHRIHEKCAFVIKNVASVHWITCTLQNEEFDRVRIHKNLRLNQ